MKYLFLIAIFCTSYATFAQSTLHEYFESGHPSSLQELANEVIKPKYAENLKKNPNLLEEYVMKAQNWMNYSPLDLTAWKTSINYLVELGYSLNESEKNKSHSVFHLTSPDFASLSTEEDHNQYVLHTSLFELGAESDYSWDGTYLEWVISHEESDSPILKAYLNDFKTWSPNRKRDWLFEFFFRHSSDDLIDQIEMMLKQNLFDVNIRSKNGKLNLFDVAISKNNLATAEMLLENGFDTNKRCFDCNGETTLHRVVVAEIGEESKSDLLKKMLIAGGNLDLRDMKTLTPIHWAIKENSEEAFIAFMDEEVEFNVNIADIKGLNYVEYFEKNWSEDRENDFFIMLMNRTELKPTPTKKERKVKKAEEKKLKKEEKKEKKKKKEEKKARKKTKKSKN